MYNTTTMHRIQDGQNRQIYNESTKERYKVYIPPGFTALHNTLPRLINNWVIGDMYDSNLNLPELGNDVKQELGFILAGPVEEIPNDDDDDVVNRQRHNDNDQGNLQRRRLDGQAGVLDGGRAGDDGDDGYMGSGRRRKSSKRSIRRIRRRSSKRKVRKSSKVRKSRNARRK